MLYINAYAVTRHRGGSEEGGWYYNHYETVKTVRAATKAKAERRQRSLEAEFAPQAYGNIYSVRGGCEYRVLIESGPHASETRTRPCYE